MTPSTSTAASCSASATRCCLGRLGLGAAGPVECAVPAGLAEVGLAEEVLGGCGERVLAAVRVILVWVGLGDAVGLGGEL